MTNSLCTAAAVLAAMGVGLALAAPGQAQAAGPTVSAATVSPIPAVGQGVSFSGARYIDASYRWQYPHDGGMRHHRLAQRHHHDRPDRFANQLSQGSRGWVDGCNAGWSWTPSGGWTYDTWPCGKDAMLTGQGQ